METGLALIGTSADELTSRRALLALHETYVAALAHNDAKGVLATFADGAQGAIRDYVAETGTLIALDGLEANANFYGELFDKYEVLRVDLCIAPRRNGIYSPNCDWCSRAVNGRDDRVQYGGILHSREGWGFHHPGRARNGSGPS